MKKCAMPAATTAKQAMLYEIQQVSFSLVDLNLYLDNHPNCQQAIDDYNQLFQVYWEMKSNYEMQYGPLANFGHCPATYPWSWINDPWPWEKAAN